MRELTDSEYAVTTDCLRIVRDQYKEAGHPTPNIESALAKLTEGIQPWTNGISFELIQTNDCAD